MFESDIERIKIELSELLITHQPFTYLRDILRMPALAQVYKDYFHAEFTWWLYEERTQRSARTHFDNDDPNAQRILQELDEQYFKNARFDREQLTAIIDTSVKSILNYTVRPRTTLKWYVFRGEPTKAIYEVYLRMMYFSDYSYLRDGFVDWLTNKGLSRNSLEIISVLEYEKFIKKIDDDTILELSPSQFTALIHPIFDFFADSSKPIEQQVVPIEAIIIFLDDKEIHVIAQKLERMLYQQGVRYISKPMFLQVVDEVLNELESQEIDDPPVFTNYDLTDSTNMESSSQSINDNTQPFDTISFSNNDPTHIQEQNTDEPNHSLDDFRSELSSVIGLSATPLPALKSIIPANEVPNDLLDEVVDEASAEVSVEANAEVSVEASAEVSVEANAEVSNEANSIVDESLVSEGFTNVNIGSELIESELIESESQLQSIDNTASISDANSTNYLDSISFEGLPYLSEIDEANDNVLFEDSQTTPLESLVQDIDDSLIQHQPSEVDDVELHQTAQEQSLSENEVDVEVEEIQEVINQEENSSVSIVPDELILGSPNDITIETVIPNSVVTTQEYPIGDDAISYLATMMNSGNTMYGLSGVQRAYFMPLGISLDNDADHSTTSSLSAITDSVSLTISQEIEPIEVEQVEEVQQQSEALEVGADESESLDKTFAESTLSELPIDGTEQAIEQAFTKTIHPNEELQSLFSKVDRIDNDTALETNSGNILIAQEVGLVPVIGLQSEAEEVELTIEADTNSNELFNGIVSSDEETSANSIVEENVIPADDIAQDSSSLTKEISPAIIPIEVDSVHSVDQTEGIIDPLDANDSPTSTFTDEPIHESVDKSTKEDDTIISLVSDETVDSRDTDSSNEEITVSDSSQQNGQIYDIISKVLGTTTQDPDTSDAEQVNSQVNEPESSPMGLGRGLSSLLSDSAKEVISATVALRPSVSNFIDNKQREVFIKKLCSRNESRFDELIAKLDKTNNWKQALASLDQFYAEQGVDPHSSVSGELKMAVYKRFINS